ncbi:M4 family metallopeptidase [Mumia qirimensis]|uniref:M4 family metallopeptidase n=1 Tax=Mumia qirimensis TaxID=3234852 RepID=UPI00351CE219
MVSRLPARAATLALAVALTASGLTASAWAAAADPVAPEAAAEALLRSEATSTLTTASSDSGVLAFVGAEDGRVDNPNVDSRDSASTAARRHLNRYGAAFGVAEDGTTLVRKDQKHSAAGQDVVRYQQKVDGVPVLGGEVVVSLRPDRQLGSVLSTASTASEAPASTVTEREAAAAARTAMAKVATGDFDLDGLGRWLVDPAVSGLTAAPGISTAWWFEASDGGALRRLILVDARSGRILANIDQVASLNRVVCDNENVPRDEPEDCHAPTRTELDPPLDRPDVDAAYDALGATSDFYDDIAGIDLTNLIGVTLDGAKTLASTVRFCSTAENAPCPFENASWNGERIVLGDGFAQADDIVAHELTHGVIEKTANLFYWGQSGAINESMADVMGEIVDHRDDSEGGETTWTLGEDLEPARSMADPTEYGDPDKMTSDLWRNDLALPYGDRGGVHTNSGVGNKTYYLISQGGAFNGQTIAGLDSGDPTLRRSATLYVATLQALTSGSDYADLGRVLLQTCNDLALAGTEGMTSAHCEQVEKAVFATELSETPAGVAPYADAPASCPVGTTKRALLASEQGVAEDKFTAGAHWGRAPHDAVPSNATSGTQSWFGSDPAPEHGEPDRSSLTAKSAVTVPAGQKTYLRFQQWRVFEWYQNDPLPPLFYDGGTVEVTPTGSAAVGTAALPWLNGPKNVLVKGEDGFPNAYAGMTAFGGDSFGWVASRLDLSSFAGKSVRPSFTVRGDAYLAMWGWYLDDIEIYTCDVPRIKVVAAPRIATSARYPATLSVTADRWSPTSVTRSYRWYRNGAPIYGATRSAYALTAADVGRRISVRVTASRSGYVGSASTSNSVGVLAGRLVASTPKIRGKTKVGRKLTVNRGYWTGGTRLTQRWYRNGKAIRGATGIKYKLTKKDRGKKIRVKVTGSKPGYATTARTSRSTKKIRR